MNKDLWLSTEGGYVKFYYDNALLQKAIVRHYSEMGQRLTEYYFLSEKLSFVFDKQYQYNAPMYWDSALILKDGGTLFFKIDSSRIKENRNYFNNGKLIRIISNQDSGAPFSETYRKSEQERINADLVQVKKWAVSDALEFNS